MDYPNDQKREDQPLHAELICRQSSDLKLSLIHIFSKIYPIEEFTAAMEMADERTEPVVKVMLKF